MKAIKIQMRVTPYIPDASVIENLRSLGAPALLVAQTEAGQSRSAMVRDALPTRSFLEWAATFEGETEIMYVKGLLSASVDHILGDLQTRQVIDSYEVVNLR